MANGKDYLDKVVPVLDACSKTHHMLDDLRNTHRFNPSALELLEGLEGQLKQLIPETFMDLYDERRFPDLIRYLQAIEIRAQRAMVHIERDREKAMEIIPFSKKLNKILSSVITVPSEEKKTTMEEFFWMLEEYKVSVFAQELKTAIPVSKKRLETKLGEIQRMV
jgi:ATP-dependent helicase HrpA